MTQMRRVLKHRVEQVLSSSCRDASTVTSLRAEFGEKAVAWFAYPYGLNRPAVHRAVAGVSYVGALRIGGGWHRATAVAAFARPRLNIPGGLSLAEFRPLLFGAVRV